MIKADSKTLQLSWPAVVAIVAIVFFAFGVVASPSILNGGATGNVVADANNGGIVKFDIPSYVPYLGSDSATVNIIEFGDYQCPFCERFFTLTAPSLMQNYVNTGKARFYFMDFSFLGPDSQTLAEGAWCANDQGKYYDYHDYVYSNQGQENSGWATIDKVEAMAANIVGLDTQEFSSCLNSGRYASRVQELTRLGQSVGVGGTPTAFVGNQQDGYTAVVGAQPYSVFQALLG